MPVFRDKTERMLHGMIDGELPFDENLTTEFKEYDKIDKLQYDWIAKEVAGMLNARGGKIVFGVKDKYTTPEQIIGIEPMIHWLKQTKQG